jgi:hypothetical protein
VSCLNKYLTTRMDHAWTAKPSPRSLGLAAPPRQACLLPTRSPGSCTAQPRSHATPTAAQWPARRPHGICTCTGKAWGARRSRSHSRTSRDDHSPRVSRSCRPWIATAGLVHPRKRDDRPCLSACLLPSAIVHGVSVVTRANVRGKFITRSFRARRWPAHAQVGTGLGCSWLAAGDRGSPSVLAWKWHASLDRAPWLSIRLCWSPL